jgi:hypothetical protein
MFVATRSAFLDTAFREAGFNSRFATSARDKAIFVFVGELDRIVY